MTTRDDDHFERIRLVAEIEKARIHIGQYEQGRAYFHQVIEDRRYKLGRLDERPGDA
jgi:hypothetical protein